MARGVFAGAVHSAKKAVLGRTRGTRRYDRLLKIEDKMEALRLKRYKARIARRRRNRAKMAALAKHAPLAVAKTGSKSFVVNPYQSCRSKAVRTWVSNLIGNQILNDGQYYNAGGLVDMTGSVSMNQCGISAYWLRSAKSPDYLYLGVSVPNLDIRQVEDTATLTALSSLYQYLKIMNIN